MRSSRSIVLLISGLAVALFAAFVIVPIFESPNLDDGKSVTVRVDRAKVRAVIAAEDASRTKGLGGSGVLNDEQGMFFVLPSTTIPVFIMKDVSFPIDIIWINGDTVIEVTPNIQPDPPGVPADQLPRYQPSAPANRVLEVSAGWAARNGIQPGDPVKLQR